MNKINIKEIKSVSDAIEIINDLRYAYEDRKGHHMNFPFWFRGHNISGKKLLPTIFRHEDEIDKNFTYQEDNIFYESKLILAEYTEKYKTTFDWLCLMQHYSLPTRLLDWTKSILVALYFAVENTHSSKNEDGEVFLLSAWELNGISTKQKITFTPWSFDTIIRSEMTTFYYVKELKNYVIDQNLNANPQFNKQLKNFHISFKENKPEMITKLSYPIAVVPNLLNNRMKFQSSVFTLHGGKIKEYPEKENDSPLKPFVSLEEINENNFILQSFKISKDKKRDIRNTLMMLGIHKGSLFPELEHQTSTIKNKWKTFKK